MIHVPTLHYAVKGERASTERRKSGPFYLTVVVKNHQFNHLPTTDFKNLIYLASSFLGTKPKKNQSHISYCFLD